MKSVIEIVIFFSSPKDLKAEKDELKKLCERINTRLESIDCNVRYLVKEWRSVMAEYGLRPQEVINNGIKKYDFYFGVWWMRFGTPSGAVDPETGIAYGSGTYEEFVIARRKAIETGLIKIFLYFKKPIATDDLGEIEQLKQVVELREREKPNNLVTEFNETQDFINNVTDYLYGEAFKICSGQKLMSTELSLETSSKVQAYLSASNYQFNTYIPRQLSGATSAKSKNKFLSKPDNILLNELIYTSKRIVLLGDAGTGKSTELKYLFNNIKNSSSTLIPIFQTLNFYIPETGLSNFLPQFWTEIHPSRLIIIWDGLDEIPPDRFSDVLKQINTFSANNPELRIVISSRTNFYEIPGSGKLGSLVGFDPYYLNALNGSNISTFLNAQSVKVDPVAFMKEVYQNGFDDLVTKPYFLTALQDVYTSKHTLNVDRAGLFEQFLVSRIEIDKIHFQGTINLKEKQDQILSLLQRVAVTMEITCKNIIEEEALLQIISQAELDLIKYSGIFNKADGEETVWQFQHNNLQEYLAAKKLSSLSFDKLISFITVSPVIKRLIPSWINTLTFLFSLLKPTDELFVKLLDWLIENEKEAIVKFERDKIPTLVRLQLFKSIFNFYKLNNIWLRSNKFSERDLSRFAQSEEAIAFLLDELKQNNSTVVKSNAVHLLGFFDYTSSKYSSKVKKEFFTLIKNANNDYMFLHSLIYNLNYSGLADTSDLKKLMKTFGNVKNQYVRGAIYSLIRSLHQENEYVDYILEGYNLVNSDHKSPEREDVTLFDESWNIEECLKKLSSPFALVKAINYLNNNSGYSLRTKHEVIEAILNSAASNFSPGSDVHDSVLNWFTHLVNDFHTDLVKYLIEYFQSTKTLHASFMYFWNSALDNHNKMLALAYLATDESLSFIITQYESRNLTRNDFTGFYSNMQWIGNSNLPTLTKYISANTDIELKVPKKIDFEKFHQERLQESFNLLFHSEDFKSAIRNVFKNEDKAKLSFDELYDVRRRNNIQYTLEERYPHITIDTIRDFANTNYPAELSRIESWFTKSTNFNWYIIGKIYWYLSNTKVQADPDQVEFINNWCQQNLSQINFKNSITQEDAGRVSYKYNAIYASYFFRRFNLKFPKSVMLDMLSFDIFENNAFIGISYLLEKLEKTEIDFRIIENFKEGIQTSSVLINHVKYAVSHNLIVTYPFIRKSILNARYSIYDRRSILSTYFEGTGDTLGLKAILDKADEEIKWDIVDLIHKSGDYEYLTKKLFSIYNSKAADLQRNQALKYLLYMQNIKALEIYTRRAKLKGKDFVKSIPYQTLSSLNTPKALNSLLQLLKLSYNGQFESDRFETFGSSILSGIQNIGLSDDKNFETVVHQLRLFISKNKKLKNVNYLHHTITALEEKYFFSKVHSYSLNEVKEKLQLIAG